MNTIRSVIRQRQLRGLQMFDMSVVERVARAHARAKELDEVAKEGAGPEWRSLSLNLPTDLQDPLIYRLLQGLYDEYASAAAKGNLSLKREPIFASEMAGELNGFSFTSDGSDYGIVVDEYFLTFSHLVSKVIVQFCSDETDHGVQFTFEYEDLPARIITKPDALHRLADLLISYAVSGTTSAAHPYLLPDNLAIIASDITRGFELFALSHECGHIYHEHLAIEPDTDEDGKPDYGPHHSSFKATMNSFRRELEADLYAFKIVFLSSQDEQNKLLMGTMGLFSFFIASELLERVLVYVRYGIDIAADAELTMGNWFKHELEPMSHPHPKLRRLSLLGWVQTSIPNYYEQCQRMDRALSGFLSGAVSFMTPNLDKYRQNGLTVHPRWQEFELDLDSIRAKGKELIAKTGGAPKAA